jgi:Piezo non-specific cation channel, R-Ras-binding domain
VQYLNDKETVQPERSVMNWKKGLRVFYSCENYWKMD